VWPHCGEEWLPGPGLGTSAPPSLREMEPGALKADSRELGQQRLSADWLVRVYERAVARQTILAHASS
jgi:hypothetical protein